MAIHSSAEISFDESFFDVPTFAIRCLMVSFFGAAAFGFTATVAGTLGAADASVLGVIVAPMLGAIVVVATVDVDDVDGALSALAMSGASAAATKVDAIAAAATRRATDFVANRLRTFK